MLYHCSIETGNQQIIPNSVQQIDAILLHKEHWSPWSLCAVFLNLLSEKFHWEVGYERVNTARGTLSVLSILVEGCIAGNSPLVNRFLRGTCKGLGCHSCTAENWDHGPVKFPFFKGIDVQIGEADGTATSSQGTNFTLFDVKEHWHWRGFHFSLVTEAAH